MDLCRVCTQPNCGRSSRSSVSFSIVLNQPTFRDHVTIPCHFKERLNQFADKWLHGLGASGHRFELFLVKGDEATFFRGPFWTSFLISHSVAINDVVSFRLITQADEEENEEEADEEDDQGVDEEDVQEQELAREYQFRMEARSPNGVIRQFHYIPGAVMPDVNEHIRDAFFRSVFTDMHLITMPDMCAITFEMMKEVSHLNLHHEDEFYHLNELQYFVTKLNGIDVANKQFVMPSSFARGFKLPKNGTALFLSLHMDGPIRGGYTIFHGNLNEIVFENGWHHFCKINQLRVGSLIVVRVEMRANCIGLFVTKIRDLY